MIVVWDNGEGWDEHVLVFVDIGDMQLDAARALMDGPSRHRAIVAYGATMLDQKQTPLREWASDYIWARHNHTHACGYVRVAAAAECTCAMRDRIMMAQNLLVLEAKS